MTQVTFFLAKNGQFLEREDIESYVCKLAQAATEKQQKMLILCQDILQVERIDEAFFQRPLSEFIPHFITGEANSYGCNLEISWAGAQHSLNRQFLLINLAENAANFSQNYQQVVDFVPTDKNLKQLARKRYRQYQMLGCEISTCEFNPFDNELKKAEKDGKNIQS